MNNKNKINLANFAYEEIKKSIDNRIFIYNQKLLYRDLEKLLGMSKTAIIVALKRLENEEYVYHRKNYGYFVNRNISSNFKNPTVREKKRNIENSTSKIDVSEISDPKLYIFNLNDAIYQKLKDYILSGKFAPGQKLIYGDLEKLLGVSKTPILNGLIRLQCEGLVYQKNNAGYYVKEINISEIFKLFEARLSLELANAPFIVKHCSDDDIKELYKIHQEYERYPTPLIDSKRLRLNSNLHLSIAKIGKNNFIIKFLKEIYSWIELRMPLTFEFLPQKRVEIILIEHKKIIDTLRDRDKRRFIIALKAHLEAANKDLGKYFKVKKSEMV